MELLAFASRLLAPKMLDNLRTTSVVIPVHSSLRASVAGGTLYYLTRFLFVVDVVDVKSPAVSQVEMGNTEHRRSPCV